jgi:lipid A 3-O-deacylase
VRRVLLAVAIALAASSAKADTGPPEPVEGVAGKLTGAAVQVIVENDFLAGTDRYYTNGIKLGITVPAPLVQELFRAPATALLDQFARDPNPPHFGLFLGHSLYTPRTITVAAPQPFDRPWAAWLYLAGVAQRAEGTRLDTVELDLGVVGPAALGQEVQTAWHGLVDAPRPRGWHNQLPNEPAFLVSYLRKRRIALAENLEWIGHAGAIAGTVMTLARAGGMLRSGFNMTGFGPDGIEPGGAMLYNARRLAEAAGRGEREGYAFVGVDLRAVAHNIFLDGTVFRDSPGVERRAFVYDFVFGVSVRYADFRFSITQVRRSEEFRTPSGGGGTQTFHSFNLGYEF